MSFPQNVITSSGGQNPDEPDHIQASNKVINIVAEILDEIVKENSNADMMVANEEDNNYSYLLIKNFLSKKPPNISIHKYLKRFMKYSRPEPSTIIIALIYIDKICDESNLQLTMLNIHRLALACLVVATKYNEDDYYSNEFYAKVGGVSLEELNQLEYNILILLSFNVYIDDELFEKYESQIKDYEQE